MRAVVLVEFSGVCRENPVRLMRMLREVGGRVVSYDSGSRLLTGTLRLALEAGQGLDMGVWSVLEELLRGLDGCRVWAKIVLRDYRAEVLSRLRTMKFVSSSGEVLVVKLPNYTYTLWVDRKSGSARMVPIGSSSIRLPGDLSEISYPCEKASELIRGLRDDFIQVFGQV